MSTDWPTPEEQAASKFGGEGHTARTMRTVCAETAREAERLALGAAQKAVCPWCRDAAIALLLRERGHVPSDPPASSPVQGEAKASDSATAAEAVDGRDTEQQHLAADAGGSVEACS